ncbi:MAG: TIGR03792 family protein [Nodosilinea sp.]
MISVFPGQVEAAPPAVVVEQLRLRVPSDALQAWLEAERGSWEPWLAQQPGFMQRQLFWDPQLQEATLLIYWASRQQWQATSSEEQQQVQQRFERLARAGTGQQQGNPFPLIFSGELLPQ